MQSVLRAVCAGSWLAVVAAHAALGAAPADQADFNRDVRPILSKHCYRCHGQDDNSRQADLRLDVQDGALAELPSGTRALVPGKPADSGLFARVTAADESLRMPPPDAGRALTSDEVAALQRWIEQGGAFAEHWSLTPPRRPIVPVIQQPDWAMNEIDYFALARLQAAGLEPSPAATRHALIRRVSLDLRGLPPTLAEVDQFVGDCAPDAYERCVDRMLADPAYGERWARVWLDLARYADSRGLGSDPLRLNMWRYRDWLIGALNANMRYDQFTVEQLAGDLLPDATLEQHMATAFHRNTMTNTEGGTDDEEFRVAAVKDRVETTARVWMGLTLQCANCHDHKYDPMSQREYYQFYALFNQTADADRPDETPVIEAPTDLVLRQRDRVNAQVADLNAHIARLTAATPQDEQAIAKLRDELARLEKSRPEMPTLPIMQELPGDKQRTTHVMLRGNFLTPGDEVQPGFLERVVPADPSLPRNRLGLARWLTDPKHPLVARVAVNRLWAQLFGTGIVETEEDFGTQGETPSHPELLDWLAIEFVDSGWDVKHMLRLMVCSATYRQSSRVTPELLEKDPRNRLFTRGPRFRLEAEMIRDQALALSGLLNGEMFGPSVYPYQPPGLWRAAFNGERTWPQSERGDRYRRGIYTFWRRTIPYPSLQTFDAPSREMCTARRVRTNTPLQAFVTLNDPVYVEAAQALARRIVSEGGAHAPDRMEFALRLCQGRPPAPEQIQSLLRLLAAEQAHYRVAVEEARQLATEPLGPAPAGTDITELAAWTVVSNVLLNLDGVLTKG
jgi:hypothetical protein